MTPEGGWYQESGQGMGATLQIANDKDAYTISDRGTYLATESARDLEILVEGGAELLNVYHVIDIAPDAGERVNAEGGKALADWLVSPAAQGEIETLRRRGVRRAAVRPGRRQDRRADRRGRLTWTSSGMPSCEAFRCCCPATRETWEIIGRSLRISLTATALALLLGLPVGAALAFGRFRGRRIALALVNTGMGVPPVVAGLVVTILLWRSGPLGALGLLYTPTAMVIAQTAIALPLVAGFSTAALQHVDPDFRLQMQALGAGRLRSLWTVAVEARLPLLAAAMAGFGAVISEVGAALMVGGNIAGQTRVLTTAAVLEASKGAFALALAFGIILLVIAFAVNLVLTAVQQHGERDRAAPAARAPRHPVAAGRRTILDARATSRIAPGETLAILGANGAGKSTLLRVAGGLRRHDRGRRAPARPPGHAARRSARVSAAVLQRPLLRRGSVRAERRDRAALQARSPGRAPSARGALARATSASSASPTSPRPGAVRRRGAARQPRPRARARARAAAARRALRRPRRADARRAPRRPPRHPRRRRAPPRCSSPTTATKPPRSPTASPSSTPAVCASSGRPPAVLDHPADIDCARVLGFENVLSPDAREPPARPADAPRASPCAPPTAGSTLDGSTGTLERILPFGAVTRAIVTVDGTRILIDTPAPAPAWAAALGPGSRVDVQIDERAARALPSGSFS